MSIKANELRIGNWVSYLNELYVVDGIKYEPNAPSSKWRIAFKTIDRKLTNAKMDNWLEPIPLTSELLEKCGFKLKAGKDDVCYTGWYFSEYINGFRMRLWFNDKNECNYSFSQFNVLTIKHLHQLQNLYFSLTGEELQINL